MYCLCSRWWPITTARRTTPTPAWYQSLYIVLLPCCAEHTSSVRTGSCCWKNPISRACSVCAPVSRTPWLLSGGGSSSLWPTSVKVKHNCRRFGLLFCCHTVSCFCYFRLWQPHVFLLTEVLPNQLPCRSHEILWHGIKIPIWVCRHYRVVK